MLSEPLYSGEDWRRIWPARKPETVRNVIFRSFDDSHSLPRSATVRQPNYPKNIVFIRFLWKIPYFPKSPARDFFPFPQFYPKCWSEQATVRQLPRHKQYFESSRLPVTFHFCQSLFSLPALIIHPYLLPLFSLSCQVDEQSSPPSLPSS